MTLREFIDRLRYRVEGYWYSEKRSVKALSRLTAFALFASFITAIAPTLADELSSDPSLQQQPAVVETSTVITSTDTATATDTTTPTFSPEPQITRPAIDNPSASPLATEEETLTAEGEGMPLKIQPKYTLRIPTTAAIDPRATTYFMPHLSVSVDDPEVKYTLACISGTGLTIDIRNKRVADNSVEGDELVTGDGSPLVLISGTTNRVLNAINATNGAFLSSTGGGLAGRSLTFRFIAVSKPVVDPEYCSAARSGVITTIRALGLDISTVKGGGKLK